LDTNSAVGIFFREQAVILKPQFNPILVVFREKIFSFRAFIFGERYHGIIKLKSIEGLDVLEIYNPKFCDSLNLLTKISRDNALNLLKRFLQKHSLVITLIHAQSLIFASFWAYRFSEKYKIPYLITEHNQISFSGISLKKQILIKTILEKSSKNLIVSSDKIRQFAVNGLYFDFINVGNLISDNFYFKRKQKKVDFISIITIGAFHPLKDQKTLFDALLLTDNLLSGVKIKFKWIGYNSWGTNVEVMVSDFLTNYRFHNIEVQTWPSLPKDEVANHLRDSDLFIFSSISEGLPVSILESLACGVPVLTSNCGGVDEIINEKNGKIYPVKDSKRLHSYLMEFIYSNTNYDNQKISQEIISHFGKTAFKNRIINIYNSIIDDSCN
jgi:glycosyltransferase involved in cell wall biosynthesis